MNINVKKLNENAIIPEFAHPTDSGFDFFTCEDTIIKPGKKAIVKTGLAFEIPQGWGIQIKNKSGITMKGCPINPAYVVIGESNSSVMRKKEIDRADITVYEGTIDMEYRGEIGIMVKNEECFEVVIPKHTKIAQGVLRKVYNCSFTEVDEIHTNTTRGENGYGSTGTTVNK